MNMPNQELELTPEQVQAARQKGAPLLLLDCRTPREHEQARIEDSTLVPLSELPQRVEELRDWADWPVVTFCHHGQRSLRAAAILRQAGFSDVRSMAGGIDGWSRQIDPDVPRY